MSAPIPSEATPAATALRRTDALAWRVLLLAPASALVAAAAAFPDAVLTGQAPAFWSAVLAAPATIYAMTRGPRPGGAAFLGAVLVAVGWYPAGWLALWRRSDPTVPFGEWFEAVNAAMEIVTTRTVMGIQTSQEVSQGVPLSFHAQTVGTIALVYLGLSLLPRARGRCHACERPHAARMMGRLPFDPGANALTGAEAALHGWLEAPAPLEPLHPIPSGPTEMVQLQTCPACGAAAVKGFLFVGGRPSGYTRVIPVPAGTTAALSASAAS